MKFTFRHFSKYWKIILFNYACIGKSGSKRGALCLAQGPTFKNPQKKLPKIECFTILSSGHSLSPEVSCPTSNMIELDDEVFLSPNNNSRGSEQSLIYDPIEALKCYRRMIEVQVLNLFMTKFLHALSVETKHD